MAAVTDHILISVVAAQHLERAAADWLASRRALGRARRCRL